ncbi:hypothetical protein K501DRAFT_335777 [Backusella circina FSU 941]|nr:hypothetical protein K501DRAFT_335777 [Backusella circina FSU 941]
MTLNISGHINTSITTATATQAAVGAETKRDDVGISSSDTSLEGRQLHPRKQLLKRMINNPLTQNNNSQKEEVDRAFEELARLIVPGSSASQPLSPSFSRQPVMRPALNQPGPYSFRRPLPPPPYYPGAVHHGSSPLRPPHGPPPPPPHLPSAPPPPKAPDAKKDSKSDKEDKEESEPEDKEESEEKKKSEEAEDKEESEESNDAKKEKEEA